MDTSTLAWAACLLTPLLGGTLSFAATEPSVRAWRRALVRSRLTPPTPLVAAIWFALYLAMGHASFVVYHTAPSPVFPCLVYVTQLLLNHFYIIVLFGLQRMDIALLMMPPLWLSTAATTALFYEAVPATVLYMGPVLAWVTFSIYLNLVLVLCNRQSYGERDDASKAKVS